MYIVGGATIYKLFMTGGAKLMPEIVVDCVYDGELTAGLEGEPVTITSCVEVLNKITGRFPPIMSWTALRPGFWSAGASLLTRAC